jgi:hypothetical protein
LELGNAARQFALKISKGDGIVLTQLPSPSKGAASLRDSGFILVLATHHLGRDALTYSEKIVMFTKARGSTG